MIKHFDLVSMLYFFDMRASIYTCWRIIDYLAIKVDMKDIIRNKRYKKKPKILKNSRIIDEKFLMIILGLWTEGWHDLGVAWRITELWPFRKVENAY